MGPQTLDLLPYFTHVRIQCVTSLHIVLFFFLLLGLFGLGFCALCLLPTLFPSCSLTLLLSYSLVLFPPFSILPLESEHEIRTLEVIGPGGQYCTLVDQAIWVGTWDQVHSSADGDCKVDLSGRRGIMTRITPYRRGWGKY